MDSEADERRYGPLDAITVAENGNDHEITVRINGNGFIELWCNGTVRLPSLTPSEALKLGNKLQLRALQASE